jgi:hypothetical protein
MSLDMIMLVIHEPMLKTILMMRMEGSHGDDVNELKVKQLIHQFMKMERMVKNIIGTLLQIMTRHEH